MATTESGALVLASLPDMTPALMRRVYQCFPSAEAFLNASPGDCPGDLAPCHARYLSDPASWRRAAALYAEQLAERGIHPLTLADPDYPPLLADIHRPPPLLFVQGDRDVLSLPQLATVGSRRATTGALRTAQAFAAELAASGFVITSGLALGVDGAAHRGALQRGRTLAVLGTGLDVCYPHQHRNLAAAILDGGGALVSEFPLGCLPRKEHFPQRNRVISGLSLGVLVVEAARGSGSLITARLAMEQGREVFAMPGSVHNPQARGCHQLIREGATLVETVGDIVEQLGGLLGYKAEELAAASPAAREPTGDAAKVLEAMGFDPVSADALVGYTGLPAPSVTAALVNLELLGSVEKRGGHYLRRR